MKIAKIYARSKAGLLVGLLSLHTLSSCVNTRQGLHLRNVEIGMSPNHSQSRIDNLTQNQASENNSASCINGREDLFQEHKFGECSGRPNCPYCVAEAPPSWWEWLKKQNKYYLGLFIGGSLSLIGGIGLYLLISSTQGLGNPTAIRRINGTNGAASLNQFNHTIKGNATSVKELLTKVDDNQKTFVNSQHNFGGNDTKKTQNYTEPYTEKPVLEKKSNPAQKESNTFLNKLKGNDTQKSQKTQKTNISLKGPGSLEDFVHYIDNVSFTDRPKAIKHYLSQRTIDLDITFYVDMYKMDPKSSGLAHFRSVNSPKAKAEPEEATIKSAEARAKSSVKQLNNQAGSSDKSNECQKRLNNLKARVDT
ncbi:MULTISPECIES: hypothetical protein [unclassified Candidatus Cardinium]|uniref:hypothetical protein n=1 Tax=unclassified Candidatus Cardinium TaxID=2641185 RepID=UPI001FB525C9|nr:MULTISPECIES: hypothetical protein [unclassified Candidatus Cardinium]